MGAEQFDLLAKLVQFGALVFLGFAFVGEFIIVFVIVALAPACGALAPSRRTKPAGPAAELMPHGDVDHDRSMMPGQAMRTRPARAGTSMGSGVTLVLRAARVMLAVFTARVMLAVRMVLSVVLAPPRAMSFAAVLMPAMRVAVMFRVAMRRAVMLMTAMRVARMGASAVMLAFVMLPFVTFMGAISVAVMPRLTVPFAVPFVAALAFAAVPALAAIVVIIIFVLFFVAALAVVVTHRQQIDFKFASVGLDGNGLVGGRDFAGQRPKDG